MPARNHTGFVKAVQQGFPNHGANLGIVGRNGARIVVSKDGRPFVRLVAATFDAYLSQNNGRHSVAV
jgi:hypothetical protein